MKKVCATVTNILTVLDQGHGYKTQKAVLSWYRVSALFQPESFVLFTCFMEKAVAPHDQARSSWETEWENLISRGKKERKTKCECCVSISIS